MSAELIAAWVAVGGGLPALVLDVLSRRQSRFDSQMSHAIDLLTGKTQRRSAGIAIVEGLTPRLVTLGRKTSPRPRPLLSRWSFPLGGARRTAWYLATCGHVSNQIVYLLASSESKDRADEIENLRRLVKLLAQLEATGDALNRVVNMLDKRRAEAGTGNAVALTDEPGRGLWVGADDLLALRKQLIRGAPASV